TENPHAHIVIRNQAIERGGIVEKEIGRLRTDLLPHKQMVNGKELLVPGRIGEKFVEALDRRLEPHRDHGRAQQAWEEVYQRAKSVGSSERVGTSSDTQRIREDKLTRQFKQSRVVTSKQSIDERLALGTWNPAMNVSPKEGVDYRIALGRHL